MKAAILALLTLTAATQALAATSEGKQFATNALMAAAGDTPYQKLESLYNQATPMPLGQFMMPTDPALKKWDCVGATEDTTADQLASLGNVPVRVQGKIVLVPARPAMPAKGPLFPATPAIPEQDKLVDAVFLVPNDGSFKASAQEIGQTIMTQKAQLSTVPGVSMTFLDDANDDSSAVTLSFRTLNGLIVAHQTSDNAAVKAKIYDYFYCYQK